MKIQSELDKVSSSTRIIWCDVSLCPLQNGMNALHLGAKEGHLAVVTELLKHGANVDIATKVRL